MEECDTHTHTHTHTHIYIYIYIYIYIGEKGCSYRVMLGKPQIKGPLGRPRHRWEDTIKSCLKKFRMRGNGLDEFG